MKLQEKFRQWARFLGVGKEFYAVKSIEAIPSASKFLRVSDSYVSKNEFNFHSSKVAEDSN